MYVYEGWWRTMTNIDKILSIINQWLYIHAWMTADLAKLKMTTQLLLLHQTFNCTRLTKTTKNAHHNMLYKMHQSNQWKKYRQRKLLKKYTKDQTKPFWEQNSFFKEEHIKSQLLENKLHTLRSILKNHKVF